MKHWLAILDRIGLNDPVGGNDCCVLRLDSERGLPGLHPTSRVKCAEFPEAFAFDNFMLLLANGRYLHAET